MSVYESVIIDDLYSKEKFLKLDLKIFFPHLVKLILIGYTQFENTFEKKNGTGFFFLSLEFTWRTSSRTNINNGMIMNQIAREKPISYCWLARMIGSNWNVLFLTRSLAFLYIHIDIYLRTPIFWCYQIPLDNIECIFFN